MVTLPFVAAIAYGRFVHGVSFDPFIFGSGSWGVGCFFKLVLYQAFVRRLPHEGMSLWVVAITNGLVSGITELGAALLAFLYLKQLSLSEVIAFGIGVGAIEAFLVAAPGSHPLRGTKLEESVQRLEQRVDELSGRSRFFHVEILGVVERILATGIHIGTRGLVYVAYRTGFVVPAIIALAVFVLADGIGYQRLYKGSLEDMRVLRRFYVFLALLSLGTVIAFLGFWRWQGF
jgi:uncharacterized membrane protein YhfC